MGFNFGPGFSIVTNPLGSVSFNGTNQTISCPDSQIFNLAATDWTIEFWVNCTDWSTQPTMLTIGPTATYTDSINLDTAWNSGNGARIVYRIGGSTGISTLLVTYMFPNIWYHVALVRSGVNTSIYVNGTPYGLTTTGRPASVSKGFIAGAGFFGPGGAGPINYFSGYISNIRVVNGVAVYTGAFTPPTAPLLGVQPAGTNISAITGTQTSLLLQTPNNAAFITDSSANNSTVTNVGTATAASLTPFVAGSGGWAVTS
jgi:Concanavalin A-like lectin/glucanases superfamily